MAPGPPRTLPDGSPALAEALLASEVVRIRDAETVWKALPSVVRGGEVDGLFMAPSKYGCGIPCRTD